MNIVWVVESIGELIAVVLLVVLLGVFRCSPAFIWLVLWAWISRPLSALIPICCCFTRPVSFGHLDTGDVVGQDFVHRRDRLVFITEQQRTLVRCKQEWVSRGKVGWVLAAK